MMSSIRLDNNYHGYNVQFSPILPRYLACSASQHYGLKGPGALFVLEVANNTLQIRQSFYWSDGLFDVAWSPLQENLVITASGDGTLQLWNLFGNSAINKNPIMCFKEHTMDVSSVDWNLNGIASGSWDGTLKIWNIEHAASRTTFALNDEIIHSVKWAPLLPRTIAVSTRNGLVLWDESVNHSNVNRINSGTELLDCDWSKHSAYLLATCGSNGMINTWDIRNWKNRLNTLCGHQRAVKRVKWSPHNFNAIASVSYDLTTVIWNVNSQSPLETIRHHSGFVHGLDFNKNVISEMADCGWDSLIHVYVPLALSENDYKFLAKNKL